MKKDTLNSELTVAHRKVVKFYIFATFAEKKLDEELEELGLFQAQQSEPTVPPEVPDSSIGAGSLGDSITPQLSLRHSGE